MRRLAWEVCGGHKDVVLARLLIIVALLMNPFAVPAVAAEAPGSAMVMGETGPASMDMAEGHCEEGKSNVGVCRMDCVFCHAITPAETVLTVYPAIYAPPGVASQPSWKSQSVKVEPPVPRF